MEDLPAEVSAILFRNYLEDIKIAISENSVDILLVYWKDSLSMGSRGKSIRSLIMQGCKDIAQRWIHDKKNDPIKDALETFIEILDLVVDKESRFEHFLNLWDSKRVLDALEQRDLDQIEILFEKNPSINIDGRKFYAKMSIPQFARYLYLMAKKNWSLIKFPHVIYFSRFNLDDLINTYKMNNPYTHLDRNGILVEPTRNRVIEELAKIVSLRMDEEVAGFILEQFRDPRNIKKFYNSIDPFLKRQVRDNYINAMDR